MAEELQTFVSSQCEQISSISARTKSSDIETMISQARSNMWHLVSRSVAANSRCSCGFAVNDIVMCQDAVIHEQSVQMLSTCLEQARKRVKDDFDASIGLKLAQTVSACVLQTIRLSPAEIQTTVVWLLQKIDTYGGSTDVVLFLRNLVLQLAGQLLVAVNHYRDTLIHDPLDDSSVVRLHDELIVKHILPRADIRWAAALFEPRVNDVVNGKWVEFACNNTKSGVDCVALLSRLPWQSLSDIGADVMVATVLSPIQQALNRFGGDEQSVIGFGSIVAHIAAECPALVTQCVALMTRAPWPARVVATPFYALIDWEKATCAQMELIFGELLMLYGTSIALQHERPLAELREHRHQLQQLLLQTERLVGQMYAADASLKAVNCSKSFPVLHTLARIALLYARAAQTSGDSSLQPLALCRVLVSDVVFLALDNSAAVPASHPLRKEAEDICGMLCDAVPDLISAVLQCIATMLPHVVPSLQTFCNRLPLSKFVPTEAVVRDLAYIATAKAIPREHIGDANAWISAYIVPSLGPGIGQTCVAVFLQRCAWETASVIARACALLLVPAVFHNETPTHALTVLTATPHDANFVRALLHLQPHSVPHVQRLVAVIQVLTLLSAADAQPQAFGGSGLLNAGLYDRATNIMALRDEHTARLLLLRMANVVQKIPDMDLTRLGGVLRVYLSTFGSRSLLACIEDSLCETAEVQQRLLCWWALVLMHCLSDDNACGVFDAVIHTAFASACWLHVLRVVGQVNVNAEVALTLAQKSRHFASLAILQTRRPETVAHLLPAIKAIALQHGGHASALLYWQAFFSVLFAGGHVALSAQEREECNRHFVQLGQQTAGTPWLSELYLSLTTWSAELIKGGVMFLASTEVRSFILSQFQPLVQLMPPVQPTESATQATHDFVQLDASAIKVPSVAIDRSYFACPAVMDPVAVEATVITIPSQAIAELQLCAESASFDFAVTDTMVRVLDAFEVQYDTLSLLDTEFMELHRRLYVNKPHSVTKRVPCQLGAQCTGPANLKFKASSVVEQTEIAALLNSNRSAYTHSVDDMRSMMATLYDSLSTLVVLSRQLVSAKQVQLGACLFELLARATLLRQRRHVLKSVASSVQNTTTTLFNTFVSSNAQPQLLLLSSIMKTTTSDVTSADASRTWLFHLFDPSSVLAQADGLSVYLHMLQQACSAPVSADEAQALAKRFDVTVLLQVLQTFGDTEQFWITMEGLLESAAFMPLACSLIRKAVQMSVNAAVPALRCVLVACQYTHMTPAFHLLFDGLHGIELPPTIAADLLQTLSDNLPTNPVFMLSVIAMIQRLLEVVDVFSVFNVFAFLQYVCQRMLLQSDLAPDMIVTLTRLLGTATAVRQQPADLSVVWTIFAEVFVVYLEERAAKGADVTELSVLITSQLSGLQWSSLTVAALDVSTRGTVLTLLDTLHAMSTQRFAVPLIRVIFLAIDWRAVHGDGDFAVSFLQLFIDLDLAIAQPLPEAITAYLAPDNTNTFLWQNVSAKAFETALNGNLQRRMLESGVVLFDPTAKVMAHLDLLFRIGMLVNSPEAAVAVAREARSVMFYSLASAQAPQLKWSLTAAHHIHIITHLFVPMTRKHTTSQSAIGPLLINLLSCIELPRPNDVQVSVPLKLVTSAIAPFFSSHSGSEMQEFRSKVKGLVLQVCTIVSQQLALEILNTACKALNDSTILCEILEQTLQTFFTHTTETSAKMLATSSFQVMDPAEFLQGCVDSHSSLALYIYLLQRKRQASDSEWEYIANWINDIVRSYIPPEHRAFDVLPLYTLLLEIADDERFSSESITLQKIAEPFDVSYGRGTREEIPLELMSKSLSLYMKRIVVQKSHGQSGRVNRELLDELDVLLALRSSKRIGSAYEEFFDAAESLLSPMTDLQVLRTFLARNLFPVAPYLENV